MKSHSVAHTLYIGVCAFLLFQVPLSAVAQGIVFDEEAERADYRGMERTETNGITNLIAEKKYAGSVTFRFDLPDSGRYRIEAKTLAPDSSRDSFELELNGEGRTVWHVPRSEDWQWNPVWVDGARDGEIDLSAGTHELIFHGREQTHLDRIKIVHLKSTDRSDNAEQAEEESNDAPGVDEEAPEDEKDANIDPTVDEREETIEMSITGTNWYVDTDGSDKNSGVSESKALARIDTALGKARPGDIIHVAPGTYREEIETARAGTKSAPITVTALDAGNRPVLDLRWEDNAPRIVHSYITWEQFEIKNFDEGVRIEGATGVTLRDNHIHHGENECVRVRYESTDNRIVGNTIHFCGATSPTTRMQRGNGEGIYLGTAPEQRSKFGGSPDPSTGNIIEDNYLYDVTEGIDLKEDAHRTTVRNNAITNASDANSGAINVRGDDNHITGNTVVKNSGAGIRLGGDSDVEGPDGKTYHYGRDNLVERNVARENSGYGYKLMVEDQDFKCNNTSENNAAGHIKSERFANCF